MMVSGKLLLQVLIRAKPMSIGEKLQDFANFIIIYVTKVGITKKKEKRNDQTKSNLFLNSWYLFVFVPSKNLNLKCDKWFSIE